MNKYFKYLWWLLVAVLGASAVGGIAINRGESINAMWFITAAVCVYAIAYRFYAAWIAAKVLVLDPTRATPAERLNNGRDFVPTNRWIVFGHHFAAIAGPGPLVGPTLAAQFGYLPGTLWILIGAVLGGAVQDMVTLFYSTRRNGRSLGQMARDELGPIGGAAALVGTFAIMIILIAVLGLVVVNAMKHSPWATSTVAATIPIAMIVGLYMRNFRVGKVLEASALGVILLLLAVAAGGWIDHQPGLRTLFDHEGLPLAWAVIAYGFAAAILPVWLLLAPRDYLSTFMKLGTVILLAIALVAALSPSLSTVILALGITYAPRLARIVRGSTLVLRELPYIEAAVAMGLPTWQILTRHVLLNLASPILVQATFVFASAMLAEASLSFLGVGVSTDMPTWGTMLASGREYMNNAPWLMVFPGLAIVFSVLALQLVGDGLRDLVDPRLAKES